MIAKFVFVLAVIEFGVGNAVPIWSSNQYNPGVFIRNAEVPNTAYSFGSGYSSNIGGISHSSGFGSAYKSGGSQAYGAGVASADGTASGIGYANAAPHYVIKPVANYQHAAPNHYINHVPNHQHVPAVSFGHGHSSGIAQNHGNFENSVSSVNSHKFGSSVSSANHNQGHQSAVASLQNPRGHGSSFAATNSYQSPSRGNGLNYQDALTSSQNIHGYNIETAQSIQEHPGFLQKTSTSHIEGPGVQVSQAHAVNAGYKI